LYGAGVGVKLALGVEADIFVALGISGLLEELFCVSFLATDGFHRINSWYSC
jgi:hypothetical protein